MKVVFVDTNFWLIIYLQKIDIFSELERLLPEKFKLVISAGVERELKKIQKSSRGKEGTAAKIALELIGERKVEVIKDKEGVDNFILKLAHQEKELVVCTNDKELRKNLRGRGVKVIVMRGKNRLDFL